ncbi:MAG TPA: glycoside hydrolase family 15 protein [Alloacidobacterium sp.]|nr:glycoside hydrolase family 15 protein [Alloacidobacterium sp.]
MPASIGDYALIGDCETAALVSREGSIDWLCWPNFASAACFAALLGDEQNGYWRVAPSDNAKCKRHYQDHTLILETSFDTEGGSARLVDFMPVRGKHSDVVRMLTGVRGQVAMRMDLVMRFDYGRAIPWVTDFEHGAARLISGPNLAILRSNVQLKFKNGDITSEFELKEGQTVFFVLTYGESCEPLPPRINHEKALNDTESFWKTWIRHQKLTSDYAEAMRRSLITLKALTYRPTGGIVAAPTTSLPEQIGGPRNWDYRYCWLRDATFTLLALMNAGFFDEARAWREWLLRAAAGSPDQLQIMYGIRGERHLLEWEVDWLTGYQNSTPVRVGNAASKQLQLDVYGEVADALLHAHLGGMKPQQEDLDLLRELTEHLCGIWQQPDSGIWEVRGGTRQFTYSKIMAWVALDRAIRNAELFHLQGPVQKWRQTREQIHKEVCEQGWNRELGSFTQYYGSKELDASLLLLPILGFLPPSDPRVSSTVDAIQKHLMRDGLLLRYDTTCGDGLPPGEGAFLACTFWLVTALSMLGRKAEATEKYEELLKLRNDVGLLAEEYDTKHRRQLGNFPQALSHIALVNSGLELMRHETSQHQRRNETGRQKPANGE